MVLISTYRDLLIEIEIYENRLDDLERELYALDRLVSTHKIELDSYVDRHYRITNQIAVIQSILEDKRETQNEVLEKLKGLEGLEYKIAYKRFIEGKTLNEIAEEINYSDSWVMKKSAAVTKKVKKEWRISKI